MKKLRKDATWEEVSRYIKEARKDPEFMKDLREFIAISEGRSRSK